MQDMRTHAFQNLGAFGIDPDLNPTYRRLAPGNAAKNLMVDEVGWSVDRIAEATDDRLQDGDHRRELVAIGPVAIAGTIEILTHLGAARVASLRSLSKVATNSDRLFVIHPSSEPRCFRWVLF